jgi:hypothetical protein
MTYLIPILMEIINSKESLFMGGVKTKAAYKGARGPLLIGGSPIQGSSKVFPEPVEDKQHDSLHPISNDFWEENERSAYDSDKI